MMILIRCDACGAVQREAMLPPGQVSQGVMLHEYDCPCFAAIERGESAAKEWCAANGNPMSAERAS
jgi:uncharacterized Zn finger protein